MERLGQITGLLCLRLASVASATLPRESQVKGSRDLLWVVLPPRGKILGRSPLGVGTRGGQMPGGGAR